MVGSPNQSELCLVGHDKGMNAGPEGLPYLVRTQTAELEKLRKLVESVEHPVVALKSGALLLVDSKNAPKDLFDRLVNVTGS